MLELFQLDLFGNGTCLKSDHAATPDWLFQALDAEFAFDFDPCPLNESPIINGLDIDWTGKRVFCNPPYSSILPWVKKALSSAALTVFLVPKRFDALWCRLLRDAQAEIRIFKRSIVFDGLNGSRAHPIGGSMICIVRRLDRL